jgi:hypothetical protein
MIPEANCKDAIVGNRWHKLCCDRKRTSAGEHHIHLRCVRSGDGGQSERWGQ